jgi:formamidopyrimidine-DNA glycosylase
MPELPEIQAHAERLTEEYVGATLQRFQPLSFVALKTAVPAPDDAYGRPLDEVGRRGKYLLARFGDRTFVVHLMQGGRLKPDEKQAAKPRFGVARWRFEDGRAWLLTEQGTERKAGVWVVAGERADLEGQSPLAGLGPEADTLGPDELGERLRAQPMRLHGFLRDQQALAGLGRRLANEVCWTARLSPFAASAKLKEPEVEALAAAIGQCVEEGVAYERTRPDMSASADRPGAVHRRTGEACPRCGDTIRAVEYRSYVVCYCPTCQTGGKVLADNTTSKFLK